VADIPTQLEVTRPIDGSHSTLSNHLQDLVTPARNGRALEHLPGAGLGTLVKHLNDVVQALGMEAEPARLFFEATEHPPKPGRAGR